MRRCALLKKAKKPKRKNLKSILSGTGDFICSRHSSMTKLCRALFKYEKERKIG